MNIIEHIVNIIKVRDELQEVQKKAEHLSRELDGVAAEIIKFLHDNGHLEKRGKK